FHILVREKVNGGITKFMLKLTTAYSMYFNKLYRRSGRLFQGTFQSSHVGEDRYLKHLFAYIHLNPIKLIEPNWKETGVLNKDLSKKHLSSYLYSSYLDYADIGRDFGLILNKKSFPDYFSTHREFSDFIDDYLIYEA
ncbi:MAG: transposase, partial [Candidatus Sungbacteria bacterium]|nr:transposase [Candidatus Sungbacteria bacterium]